MSGAEPGGPAVITLEELDGMAEESPDSAYHSHGSSLEEEAAERMEDEEQERLLSYWQSVGRGHQVDVPRGKSRPGAGGRLGSPPVPSHRWGWLGLGGGRLRGAGEYSTDLAF